MTDELRRLRIDMSAHEFCVFRSEKTLRRLLRTVRDDDDFEAWRSETLKTVALAHPVDPETAADAYADIVEAYASRYVRFFEDDDAFEQFKQALVDSEHQTCLEVHRNISEEAERRSRGEA